MGIDSSSILGALLPGFPGTQFDVLGLGKKKSQPASAPIEAPQMAKSPDASKALSDTLGMGQAGGAPGIAQTMLTGAGGIDPNLLKLGRSTLLGG